MANTNYLKLVVEPFIVNWVSERIRICLTRQKVIVGLNRENRPVNFEFDGVSEDHRIGLQVSMSRTFKSGGVRKLFMDAAILLNAPFQRRIMVLGSEDMTKNFLNKCDGLLPLKCIEFLVCDDIPEEMKDEMRKIAEIARNEVGYLGRGQKLGVMSIKVHFPNHVDSGRTTIGTNNRFAKSELGQFLCREPKAYPRSHKFIPEGWTIPEINRFTEELDEAMEQAEAKGDGYWPAMLSCVGAEVEDRHVFVRLFRDMEILRKDENEVVRQLAGALDQERDYTVHVWVLAGKELPQRTQLVSEIARMMQDRFCD